MALELGGGLELERTNEREKTNSRIASNSVRTGVDNTLGIFFKQDCKGCKLLSRFLTWMTRVESKTDSLTQ